MKKDDCTGLVAGRQLNISGADFLRNARTLLTEPLDAPTLAFVCDAVRLWREHEDMATKGPAK